MPSRCERVFLKLSSITPFGSKIAFAFGSPSEFKTARARAYCYKKGSKVGIVVNPVLETESDDRILGVIAHEFGHAAAFLLDEDDHSERECDKIAERLFGLKIYYDADDIQCVSGGTRPRPARLG